jgi:hypothetical protein
MDLEELLRGALRRAADAGRLGVKATDLTPPELNELLTQCVDFLWAKRTEPSPRIEGWWLSAGGIRPWWEKEAHLTEREALSLRPLRTEAYDVLEERGLIVKGPGNVVPIHVSPPELRHGTQSATELITVTATGAGYGDPVTNARVEKAAMELVAASYRDRGWDVEDVSARKEGWDLTARRAGDERHLEVKGVSGTKPTILLTHNEHAKAGTDSTWRLAVVTQALTSATLTEFAPAHVLAASAPHVFRVQLA